MVRSQAREAGSEPMVGLARGEEDSPLCWEGGAGGVLRCVRARTARHSCGQTDLDTRGESGGESGGLTWPEARRASA
jgi:hypothetical protein